MSHRVIRSTGRLLVLVVALAAVGAGTATAAKLITGKQVKDRSLTGKDVRKASLGPAVLSAAAKQALTGPQGEPGAKGEPGPAGPAGPSDVYTHRRAEASISDANTRTVATQSLPAGTYAFRATLNLSSPNGGKTQKCALRSGVATDLATETFTQSSGERTAVTIATGATVPEGQVRVICFVDDDLATVTNVSIQSIRTANAVVTSE